MSQKDGRRRRRNGREEIGEEWQRVVKYIFNLDR